VTQPRGKPGPKGDRASRLALRLTDREAAAIDARATKVGVKRSEMVRRMLAYSEHHMPEDEEAVAALDALSGQDQGEDHGACDEIVLSTAPRSVQEAVRRLMDRSEDWWYE